MSFLFPSFLWGLLAVSVPIAIHIFNFRRTKRIYFTNVAFLKAVDTQTRSVRQIKHWLVLLARILAIVCLVFAFAQPFLSKDESSPVNPGGITSIYLDNSFSMQNELNSKRYLDVATTRLGELLGLMRNATSLQMVTNDFSAQEQGLFTSEKIRDILTTVNLSLTPRTLPEVYTRQKNLIARQQNRAASQLFWFSDFQKSTAGKLSELKTDSSDRLFLVPVQAQTEKNVYVDSAWLNTPFIRELQNNILLVKVSNSGNEPAQNVVLKLTLDNTQSSTASVNIPANGSATAKFNFNLTGKGYKKGKITFDDFPVTFDNEYFFVLNASPVIKVLHIYDNASEVKYIENVYANDSLFSLQNQSISNIDPGLLKNADLVILNGVNKLSPSFISDLTDFVQKGGSLTIIPSAFADLENFTQLASGVGISGLSGITSDTFPAFSVVAPDRNNPFFSDVFEESVRNDNNLNLPIASPIWTWNKSGNQLLTLRNGQSFLAQTNIAQGKTYIFSSPLVGKFSTMAQHALFVPVMYKIAAASVRQQRTSYTFDENPINLPVFNSNSKNVYKLRTGKNEIIPIQRIAGGQLLLELPEAGENQGMHAGYYELLNGDSPEQMIALNHNHNESKLDYYSPDELRKIFATQKNVKIFDRIDDSDFAEQFRKQSLGVSLWKYFLYGALLFLLVEIGLIQFMK